VQFRHEATRCTDLVEDVVVPLACALVDHARLLQQVRPHAGPGDAVLAVEVDLYELAETGRIVVSCGLRVAYSLETIIIISLFMSPLLGHRLSLLITHEENGP
jgi:hypothetical protein